MTYETVDEQVIETEFGDITILKRVEDGPSPQSGYYIVAIHSNPGSDPHVFLDGKNLWP
jgi:hypothetical protein